MGMTMGRYAIVEDGVVQNVATADAAFAMERGWIASNTAQVGDLWDGQTFTTPAPTPVVPTAVSMRQGRLALRAAGLLSVVDAAINNIADPDAREDARIDWEYATEIRRDSPLVTSLGPALGLSDAQIDALFVQADAL